LIVRIGVTGRKVGTWVDWTTVLEHLEVKVIAGGTTGVALKADRLASDNRRTVRGDKSLEMSVEIGRSTGVEDAVCAKPAGTTYRIQARHGAAQGTVKDSIRNRDDESFRGTDDVDAGMRMLPWRISVPLAHIEFWAVHRSPDDDVSQRAAGG
jgi:hypothetical protein